MLPFTTKLFFYNEEAYKKRPQTHIATGFTAQIKNIPKNEKSYQMVTFGRKKSVFGIFQDTE